MAKDNSANIFSKNHTLITKGILLILLLAHHVFYPDIITAYGINTILDDVLLVNRIVLYFKICIAGFAFLTAFGTTRILKARKDDSPQNFFRLTVTRLLKLESAVFIIYFLAIIYKQFIMGQSLKDLYTPDGRNIPLMALRMFIDMIGMANYSLTPTVNMTWWYLSFAILLISAMPFIYMAYKKFRYLLLPVGCLLPYTLPDSNSSFFSLLPIVILGTAFSYEDWFERIRAYKKKGSFAIGLIASSALLYSGYLVHGYVNITFCYILAFVIPYLVYEYISYIPIIRSLLKYLGKHATNIFLTHTFIYYYFYPDFIYSFHSTWYILPILIITSLGVSIVIELIKNFSGYNRLTNKLLRFVNTVKMRAPD